METFPKIPYFFGPARKRAGPQKEMIVFQSSIFRGELLVSGRVNTIGRNEATVRSAISQEIHKIFCIKIFVYVVIFGILRCLILRLVICFGL